MGTKSTPNSNLLGERIAGLKATRNERNRFRETLVTAMADAKTDKQLAEAQTAIRALDDELVGISKELADLEAAHAIARTRQTTAQRRQRFEAAKSRSQDATKLGEDLARELEALMTKLEELGPILLSINRITDDRAAAVYEVLRECVKNADQVYLPIGSAVRGASAGAVLTDALYATGLGRTGIELPFVSISPARVQTTLREALQRDSERLRVNLARALAKREKELAQQEQEQEATQ